MFFVLNNAWGIVIGGLQAATLAIPFATLEGVFHG
jgi:hypothetical protein